MSSESDTGAEVSNAEQTGEGVVEGETSTGQSSGCCGRRISRRRRIVYLILCAVLAVLIGLMTAIIVMQVKYLTHEDHSQMAMNSTSLHPPENNSTPAGTTTPSPVLMPGVGGPGGSGSGGTPPMVSTPLDDPTHEHAPIAGDMGEPGADQYPHSPTQRKKPGERGRSLRPRPGTGSRGRSNYRSPVTPSLTSPHSSHHNMSNIPTTLNPVRTSPKRHPQPGRPSKPRWRSGGRFKPKYRHGMPYPKRPTSKTYLRDIFLYLIICLFTFGVLLVVVTVVVVRYLNARKRQQHAPLCPCFPCCVGQTPDIETGSDAQGPGQDIPLENLNGGRQNQGLDVITEEPSGSDEDNPTVHSCDDQGSHRHINTQHCCRERTDSTDTGSIGTNMSEPPPYCLAVELPQSGEAAPSGPNQPPSYDDAVLAASIQPT